MPKAPNCRFPPLANPNQRNLGHFRFFPRPQTQRIVPFTRYPTTLHFIPRKDKKNKPAGRTALEVHPAGISPVSCTARRGNTKWGPLSSSILMAAGALRASLIPVQKFETLISPSSKKLFVRTYILSLFQPMKF